MDTYRKIIEAIKRRPILIVALAALAALISGTEYPRFTQVLSAVLFLLSPTLLFHERARRFLLPVLIIALFLIHGAGLGTSDRALSIRRGTSGVFDIRVLESPPPGAESPLTVRIMRMDGMEINAAARLRTGSCYSAGDLVRLRAFIERGEGWETVLSEREALEVRSPRFSPRRFLIAGRNGLVRRLGELLPERSAALASATILGQSGGLSREDRETFSRAGAAHLLALSGLHVGIIAFLIFITCRASFGEGRLSTAVSAAGIAIYASATGAAASVVRAAVMAEAFLIARFTGRRTDAMGAISAAMIVTLLLDPGAFHGTGFQLTYSAAFGLILWRKLLLRVGSRFKGAALPLAVAVTAQLWTAPPAASAFHNLSLYAFISNAVVAPVFGLEIIGGIMVLFLGGIPVIGPALAGFLDLFSGGIFSFLKIIGNLPYADLPVSSPSFLFTVIYYTALILPFIDFIPARIRKAGTVVVVMVIVSLTLSPRCGNELLVTNREEGSIVTLEISSGERILVYDCARPDLIREALARAGWWRTDLAWNPGAPPPPVSAGMTLGRRDIGTEAFRFTRRKNGGILIVRDGERSFVFLAGTIWEDPPRDLPKRTELLWWSPMRHGMSLPEDFADEIGADLFVTSGAPEYG